MVQEEHQRVNLDSLAMLYMAWQKHHLPGTEAAQLRTTNTNTEQHHLQSRHLPAHLQEGAATFQKMEQLKLHTSTMVMMGSRSSRRGLPTGIIMKMEAVNVIVMSGNLSGRR